MRVRLCLRLCLYFGVGEWNGKLREILGDVVIYRVEMWNGTVGGGHVVVLGNRV